MPLLRSQMPFFRILIFYLHSKEIPSDLKPRVLSANCPNAVGYLTSRVRDVSASAVSVEEVFLLWQMPLRVTYGRWVTYLQVLSIDYQPALNVSVLRRGLSNVARTGLVLMPGSNQTKTRSGSCHPNL